MPGDARGQILRAVNPAPATIPPWRLGFLLYGILAYAVFAISLLWAILFIAGLGPVPGVDRPIQLTTPLALGVDLGLLALFAIQHSVMARPEFKRILTRVVPEGAERSTYVLAASLSLILIFWQWRSLPGSVWEVGGAARAGLWAGYVLGWITLVAATFMIDHLDLFGLRQAWCAARGSRAEVPRFEIRWLYAWMRHPMMTGFLILFWATPRMSLSHLVFAGAASLYILVGIWFEERDLLRGIPEYAEYRVRVGSLFPKPARSTAHAKRG